MPASRCAGDRGFVPDRVSPGGSAKRAPGSSGARNDGSKLPA